MKRIIYNISLLLAVTIGFTACNDKADSDYVPGTPTPANSMQVYFDASNAADFINSPGEKTSVDIIVSRKDDTQAAEVPIICKSAAEGLTIPSSVSFKAGEKSTTLTIGLGTMEENKKYAFSLAIGDEYADHYTELNGSSIYSAYVMEASWDTYVPQAVVSWKVRDSEQTWNTEIERLGSTNRYRIKDFVGSGLDMTFTVGGAADGQTGYYKMEPYTNYENWSSDGVNCFLLYDTANGEYPQWTLGEKTISRVYIMRSYTGYGDYSYISFSKGYGLFGTYYTEYTDGSSDGYNYIHIRFAQVEE